MFATAIKAGKSSRRKKPRSAVILSRTERGLCDGGALSE
jgi:hypothetical protein